MPWLNTFSLLHDLIGPVIFESKKFRFGVPVAISKKVNIWHEIEVDGAGLTTVDNFTGKTGLLEEPLNLVERVYLYIKGAMR